MVEKRQEKRQRKKVVRKKVVRKREKPEKNKNIITNNNLNVYMIILYVRSYKRTISI